MIRTISRGCRIMATAAGRQRLNSVLKFLIG